MADARKLGPIIFTLCDERVEPSTPYYLWRKGVLHARRLHECRGTPIDHNVGGTCDQCSDTSPGLVTMPKNGVFCTTCRGAGRFGRMDQARDLLLNPPAPITYKSPAKRARV